MVVMNNTEVLLVVGGLSTLIFNVSILYITLHTMYVTRNLIGITKITKRCIGDFFQRLFVNEVALTGQNLSSKC